MYNEWPAYVGAAGEKGVDCLDWFEILIHVPTAYIEQAESIANMTVPYGIYTEDYSDLERGAKEIAHIDLIDEELLAKDRNTAVIHIYISPEANSAEALAYLEERLSAEKVPFELTTGAVKESDWANNWKQFFHVTEIGEKLVICPSWEQYIGNGNRAVLNIDPGAAFGTGTHATTRMCLELLERYVTPESEMLDVGSGSGILSIAALLLGAKRAVGVDIDPLAVKVATENARLNRVDGRAAYRCGDLTHEVSGSFDVICANIVADVVMLLTPDVRRFLNRGGVFICSGIIDIRADEVEACLAENGFEIAEAAELENWRAYAVKIAEKGEE